MSVENITFEGDHEQMLFAEATLGLEVESFLNSKTGRWLHGRAKLELEEIKSELLNANPNTFFGRRKIKKLQNRAQLAQWFMDWCTEAIVSGRNAEIQLEQGEM